jgi:hypothetical protein
LPTTHRGPACLLGAGPGQAPADLVEDLTHPVPLPLIQQRPDLLLIRPDLKCGGPGVQRPGLLGRGLVPPLPACSPVLLRGPRRNSDLARSIWTHCRSRISTRSTARNHSLVDTDG